MKNDIAKKNDLFLTIESLRKEIFYDRSTSPPTPTDMEPTNHKLWGNFIAAHRKFNEFLKSAEKRTDIIIVVQERFCMKGGMQYVFMLEYATKSVDFEERVYQIEQYSHKHVYNCISIGTGK